jgi:hypothetical protein
LGPQSKQRQRRLVHPGRPRLLPMVSFLGAFGTSAQGSPPVERHSAIRAFACVTRSTIDGRPRRRVTKFCSVTHPAFRPPGNRSISPATLLARVSSSHRRRPACIAASDLGLPSSVRCPCCARHAACSAPCRVPATRGRSRSFAMRESLAGPTQKPPWLAGASGDWGSAVARHDEVPARSINLLLGRAAMVLDKSGGEGC